jgi:hypothetical protein
MTENQEYEYVGRVQQIIGFLRDDLESLRIENFELRVRLQRDIAYLETDLIEFFGSERVNGSRPFQSLGVHGEFVKELEKGSDVGEPPIPLQ